MSRLPPIIVPNMDQFIRDTTDHGPVGALLLRLKLLTLRQLLRLIKLQLPHLLSLIRRDFTTAIFLLADTELVKYKSTPEVILASPITDLALALNNHQLFHRFLDHIHHNFKASAGFATNNPHRLILALGRWRLSPDILQFTSSAPHLPKTYLTSLPPSLKLYLPSPSH